MATMEKNKILQLADDFLLAGQRLCEWCGHGPYLEEDLALSNMALDLLGSAQEIYEFICANPNEFKNAGIVIDGNRPITTQNLAYFRNERHFFNHIIFELPKGDFGFTLLKQYILALYATDFLKNEWVCPLSKKILNQMAYHQEHCEHWIKILGLGSDEKNKSLERMQRSCDELSMYLGEFDLNSGWYTQFSNTLKQTHLQCSPKKQSYPMQHSEHIGFMLSVMQVVPRSYPSSQW